VLCLCLLWPGLSGFRLCTPLFLPLFQKKKTDPGLVAFWYCPSNSLMIDKYIYSGTYCESKMSSWMYCNGPKAIYIRWALQWGPYSKEKNRKLRTNTYMLARCTSNEGVCSADSIPALIRDFRNNRRKQKIGWLLLRPSPRDVLYEVVNWIIGLEVIF
jgi:hypothetical protein